MMLDWRMTNGYEKLKEEAPQRGELQRHTLEPKVAGN